MDVSCIHVTLRQSTAVVLSRFIQFEKNTCHSVGLPVSSRTLQECPLSDETVLKPTGKNNKNRKVLLRSINTVRTSALYSTRWSLLWADCSVQAKVESVPPVNRERRQVLLFLQSRISADTPREATID